MCGKNMRVVALAVLDNNRIDGYDGLNNRLDSGTSQPNVDKFRKIVGV